MRTNKGFLTGLLLILAGLLSACQGRPEGWTPVLEETSTTFLEVETQRVLERVQAARKEVMADPSGAEATLLEAERSLEHLTDYYLPLLQARERAYNAYRSFFLNDQSRVVQELSRIEVLLEAMAEAASGSRFQEVEALAEALADARVAVEAGEEEGRAALESLARELNQAALKGDLILQG